MRVPKWQTYSLILSAGIILSGWRALAQEIFDPRAIALGAQGGAVIDGRAFVDNPAGMVGMKDWDFNTSTYVPTSVRGGGFVFYGFGLGKRFLGSEYAALQYSPGAILQFVVPSNFRVVGKDISTDNIISYDEPVAFGYAHQFSDQFSLGIAARLRSESITDQLYESVNDTSIVPEVRRTLVDEYLFDAGLLWRASPAFSLSVSGRGLAHVISGTLPDELKGYDLPRRTTAAVGAAWNPAQRLSVFAEATSRKYGALGAEWAPSASLALRGGAYLGSREQPFAYAVALGGGWTYDIVSLDACFLHFLSQTNRTGSALTSAFDAGSIGNLSMSSYASDKVSVSLKAILGNIRERVLRIESVEITGSVFPSAYEAFAYRPIGKVRVKNLSTRPVQAKASLFVGNLMDNPTETSPVTIPPGETAEIPLTALFDDRIKAVSRAEIREAAVSVRSTFSGNADDTFQARLLIRGRNDWDGDVHALRYFVRPDDPGIVEASRDILQQNRDSLLAAGGLAQFTKAKILINSFFGKLVYVSDPKQGGDYVQYPMETLHLGGGDCDDISVCFASLLSSIGISTAFVEVVPPGHPERSHIYLLFDTGVQPQYGASIAGNPKRYIVRKEKTGEETIWLPVEATAIGQGFDEAWTRGAQEYFDDVEVGLGLVKGWVRIVDVF